MVRDKWIIWAMILCGILAAIFYFTVTANATTYYVATAGDDEAAGTTGVPWKTITKVNAASFSAGDSILFNKGDTWTGTQLTVPHDSLYFSSYGTGAKPVIDGNNSLQYGIYMSNKSYVTIDGFIIKKFRKNSVATYAVSISGGSYDTVKNCDISEVYYATNPFYDTPSVGTDAHDWEHQYCGGIEMGSDGGEISGNIIRDCGMQGINYGTGGTTLKSNLMLIHDNEITNCNIFIRVSTSSVSSGIAIQNVKIYNNYLHDFNNYYRCNAWHRDGIQIFCTPFTSIPGNTASFDNFEIYNNYFADYVNHTTGATAWLYIEYRCTNFKIHHNVFGQGCGYYTIRVKTYTDSYIAGHEFYNNTIGSMFDTSYDLYALDCDNALGCKIKNNILFTQRIAYAAPDVDASNGFEADNNLICRLDGHPDYGVASIYGGLKEFAELQAAGLDTHSILVSAANYNTVMVNCTANPAVANDFKLTSSSPAIDVGDSTLGFTTDYNGDTIPQGDGYDIGAFEYDSSPPSPTSLTSLINRASYGTLAWTKAATGDSTQIYQDGAWIASVPIAIETYSPRNRVAGTSYNYYIVTKNGTDLSGASNAVRVTTPFYVRGWIR